MLTPAETDLTAFAAFLREHPTVRDISDRHVSRETLATRMFKKAVCAVPTGTAPWSSSRRPDSLSAMVKRKFRLDPSARGAYRTRDNLPHPH